MLAVHLSDSGRQLAAAQFGSSTNDGVDPFGEPNLFASPGPDGSVLVTGCTQGAPAAGGALGNGDVFLATVAPATGLPS